VCSGSGRMGANLCAGDRGRQERSSSLDGGKLKGGATASSRTLQAWLNDYSELAMEVGVLQARSKFPTLEDVYYAQSIDDRANLLYIFELMVVGTRAVGKDTALWDFFQEHQDDLEKTIDFEELAHIAALSGEMKYVQCILKHIHDPLLIRSIFECAISNENTDVAQYILSKHNINLNALLPGTGTTYLHIACVYSNVDIVRLLLKHGARPDVKSDVGDTAMDIASRVFETRKSIEADELEATKQHKVYENAMIKEHASGQIIDLLQEANSVEVPCNEGTGDELVKMGEDSKSPIGGINVSLPSTVESDPAVQPEATEEVRPHETEERTATEGVQGDAQVDDDALKGAMSYDALA